MSENRIQDPDPPRLDEPLERRRFLARAGRFVGATAVGDMLVRAAPALGAGTVRRSKQTLHVWYLTGGPSETTRTEKLAKAFAQQHGVTVQVTPYGFTDMDKAMRLSIGGHTGPDVGYVSPGPSASVAYAKAGGLVDLTQIARQRGWTKRFASDVISSENDPADPKRIWGMPYDMVTVGCFYNKRIFDGLGLTAPTTFPALDRALAKIKASGKTPIALGGKDVYPIGFIFDQFDHGNVPFEYLTRLQYLDPKASFQIPAFVQVATKLKQWADSGFFNDGFLGTSDDDARNLFINEQTAMFIDGTWNNATFVDQAKFPVRFFPTPRMNPRLPWHQGGFTPNNVWVVSKFSGSQQLALQFVDYMLGAKVARALWDSGDISAYRFPKVPPTKSPLQRDTYVAMQKTKTGYYLGSNSPEFQAVLGPVIQKLVVDKVSPQDAVKQIQAAYKKAATAKK